MDYALAMEEPIKGDFLYLYTEMVSNAREVKEWKAIVILSIKESMEAEEKLFDYHLTISDSLDEFTAIPTAILLQLVA